jgi:hypothetical protein
MQLNLKTFLTLLGDAATAVQNSAAALLNLDPGSVLRAILESNASVGMWMQSLFYNVLLTTRLATSGGTDADSFGADFGFFRLPATAATGTVTFSRFSPIQAALITPGVTVTTLDNSEEYTVTTDTTNGLWNPTQGGYVIPPSTSSGTVPVVASVAGSAGNVGIGLIGNISSVIPFVDTVTNSAAFTNGSDAESDAAFRTRFALYIQSLSRGTVAAIGYAISSVQQGLTFTVQEDVDAIGNYLPGNLVITVDDGSGNPSTALLNAVNAQINLYRPAGVSYNLFGPSVVNVNVVFNLIPAAGYTFGQIVTAVEDAVSSYVNSLAVGMPLYYSRIAQVAYDSTSGVLNVNSVTLNTGTSDIIPTLRQVVKTTSVTINT